MFADLGGVGERFLDLGLGPTPHRISSVIRSHSALYAGQIGAAIGLAMSIPSNRP